MITIVTPSSGGPTAFRVRDLLPGLCWDTRPDVTGSRAPEDLQRAWVATAMAIREIVGAVTPGRCLWLNFVARPLVENLLGEPVRLRAGFAMFVTGPGGADCSWFGNQYCPDKWRQGFGMPLIPPTEHDFHAWLETETHVIDLSPFQVAPMMEDSNEHYPIKGALGTWPPMLYWPKRELPKHPREAWEDRKLLVWHKDTALWRMDEEGRRMLQPIVVRAHTIYEWLHRGEKVDPAPTDLMRAALWGAN